jgi:hypothetical protein
LLRCPPAWGKISSALHLVSAYATERGLVLSLAICPFWQAGHQTGPTGGNADRPPCQKLLPKSSVPKLSLKGFWHDADRLRECPQQIRTRNCKSMLCSALGSIAGTSLRTDERSLRRSAPVGPAAISKEGRKWIRRPARPPSATGTSPQSAPPVAGQHLGETLFVSRIMEAVNSLQSY